MNRQNVFAGAFVDRSGQHRDDPDWLASAIAGPDARFAPVWQNRCLIHGDPPAIRLLEHRAVDPVMDPDETVFLGFFEGHPVFAFDVDALEAPFADAGEYHDLRYLGTVLAEDQANLVAHAIAVTIWHQRQRFCGTCGAPTRADSGGNTRSCVDVKY